MWNSDFYFNDYDEKIQKSYLTYISEDINKYNSFDDNVIKCMILEDFLALYEHSKFKTINDKNHFIELNKINLIYNNLKKNICCN